MAITYVGAASAASDSVSLPTFQAGDFAVVTAYQAGTTIPSVPSGWTAMGSGLTSGAYGSVIAGYRYLQAGDTTTGTWTNAEKVGVVVRRGVSPGCPWDTTNVNPGYENTVNNASNYPIASYPGSGNYSTTVECNDVIAPSATTAKSVGDDSPLWTNRTSGLSLGWFGSCDAATGTATGSYSFDASSNYGRTYYSLRAASTFPQVADQDTKSGTVTSNSNSWTLTYPTNIAAGDLLIAMVAVDGTPSLTWPDSTWIGGPEYTGGAAKLALAKRDATGSETGTFTLTLGASEQGAWRIVRIPAAAWSGTLGTGSNWNAVGEGGVAADGTWGTTNAPDPPSLNPINWATEDTLWIAVMAADTSRTVSDWPDSTVDNGSLVSGGTGGATLAWARTESAVASWDPTTFTISNSDDWGAATIAIRPAAGAVPGSSTADAVIKKTVTGSFTADAVSRKTTAGSLTVDATVKREQTGSFTADAVIWATVNGSFTADAFIHGSLTADAEIVVGAVTGSFTADAVLKRTIPGSLTADAVIRRTITTETATLTANDTFTEAGTGVIALTAHTPELGGAWANSWNKETGTGARFLLDRTNDRVGAGNTVANDQLTAALTSWTLGDGSAQLRRTTTGATFLSGPAVRQVPASPSNFYMLAEFNNLYRFTNGIFTQIGSFSGSGDWFRLQATGANPTTLKADRRTSAGELGSNWLLTVNDNTAANQTVAGNVGLYGQTGSGQASGTVDDFSAYSVGSTGPTLDAVIRRTQTGSLTANAVIKKTIEGSVVANAVVFRAQAGSLTVDAWINATQEGSLTADAVIRRTQEGSLTADAVIRRTVTVPEDISDSFTEGGTTLLRNHVADTGQTWTHVWDFWGDDAEKITVDPATDQLYLPERDPAAFAVDGIGSPISGSVDVLGTVRATCAAPATSRPGVVARAQSGSQTFYLARYVPTGYLVLYRGADSIADQQLGFSGVPARIRLRVVGSSPTRLLARAWPEAQAEPSTWDVDTTDNTVGYQDAGYVGVHLASQVGNGSDEIDDFLVLLPGLTADAVIQVTQTAQLAAEAIVRRTASATSTADAVIRKTIDGGLAADAVVRREQAGSFTANAIVQRTTEASFTADAFVHGQLTADAVISVGVQTIEGSFTTDAVIQRTQAGSLAANAAIFKEQAGSFATDAVLRRAATGSFTADAVIQKTIPGSVSADAVLWRAQSGSFTANAVTSTTEAGSFTADAVVIRSETGSLTVDAVVFATMAGSLTANAVLAATIEGDLAADAVLEVTWGGWSETGSNPSSGVIAANAVIRASMVGSVSADAVIRREATGAATADAVVLATRTGAATAEAVVQATLASSFAAAAFIHGQLTADAVVRTATGGSLTADAFVAGSLTADAVLQRSQGGSVTADSFIAGAGVGAFAADAVLAATSSASFVADATKQQTFQGQLVANAVLHNVQTGSLAADAVTARSTATSFSADAAISSEAIGAIVADAWLLRAQTGSFTADAELASPSARTGSFTADAVSTTTVGGSITADALARAIQSSAFTADAFITEPQFGAITADAVLLGAVEGNFNAQAVLFSIRSATFAADAVTSVAVSGAFPADAVIAKTVAASVTADAVVLAPRTVGVAADAVILSSQIGSITADAYVAELGTGALTADAVIVITTSDSVTADAFIVRPIRLEDAEATLSAVLFSATLTIATTFESTLSATATAATVSAQIASATVTAAMIEAASFSRRVGQFAADAVIV